MRLRLPLVTCITAALVLAASGVAAQGCTDCVMMDTVATLDLSSAPTYPSPEGQLARRGPAGAWAYVDRMVRTEVLVFGSDGRFERTLGRPGDGPGEFGAGGQGITGLTFDAADSLWVFSRGGSRADVFGPDFAWARTVTLAERVRRAVPVGGGRFAAVTQTLGGAQIALLDGDGRLTPLSEPDVRASDPLLIALAGDRAGRFWVSETHAYRVWEVGTGGNARPVTGNAPDWFAETFSASVRAEFTDMLDTRGATILALAPDPGRDVLWVTVGVPSSSLGVAAMRRAIESQDPNAPALMIDHVVVGVRLSDGEPVAQGRFDYLSSLRAGHPYAVVGTVLLKVLAPVVR